MGRHGFVDQDKKRGDGSGVGEKEVNTLKGLGDIIHEVGQGRAER